MSARRARVVGLADLGEDADAVGGEGAAELAVAADEGRQRAGAGCSTVQRIMSWNAASSASGSASQACRSGRSIQAGRRRGGRRPRGDPRFAAGVDPLESVQVGPWKSTSW